PPARDQGRNPRPLRKSVEPRCCAHVQMNGSAAAATRPRLAAAQRSGEELEREGRATGESRVAFRCGVLSQAKSAPAKKTRGRETRGSAAAGWVGLPPHRK